MINSRALFPSVLSMFRSRGGVEMMCVRGFTNRASAFMWPSVTAGSSPDKHYCRRHSMIWRRWGRLQRPCEGFSVFVTELYCMYGLNISISRLEKFVVYDFVFVSGAVHEAASPQEEAAARSAGSRLRGRRPEGQTGPQLGEQWVWRHRH